MLTLMLTLTLTQLAQNRQKLVCTLMKRVIGEEQMVLARWTKP